MSAQARIAIVAFSAPPLSAGGVASAHYNLFKALRDKGYQAKLFTFGDPRAGEEDGIVRRGGPSWFAAACHWLNGAVSAVLGGRKVIFQVRDILSSQPGARRMARALRKFDPQVVVLSDHGAPGLALNKQPGTRVMLVSHHNPARFQDSVLFPEYSTGDARLAVWLENRLMHKIDLVVCPSGYMADWFRRTYTYSGPSRTIPNVLDSKMIEGIQAIDLRPELGLDPDTPLVYLPSAGSRMKGAEFVPELIHRLHARAKGKVGFYLPGPMAELWGSALEEASAGANVHAPGQVPYPEHIAIVKACSFGISPSLLENYSMALLEAVYCGVPMLAFDSGGNPDIIHTGENGYLAPVGEIDPLIDVANTLLEPAQLRDLRKRTLRYAQTQLAPEKAIEQYVEAIEWLRRG